MIKKLPPILLPIIATACWGGNFTVGRWVGPDMPPLALTFWRWLLATLVLLPFVWPHVRAHASLIRRHFPLLFVLGTLSAGMFQAFIYIGLKDTTTINAALLMSVIPLAIPIAAFVLASERPNPRIVVGVMVSIMGVGVITARGDMAALASFAFNPGDLWVLASVPVWATYSVLLRRLPGGLPPNVTLFVIAAVGTTVLLPFYLWEFSSRGAFALSPGNLAAIAYVSLFAGLVAFATWNRGVAELGASRAGVFLHLIPVFAAVFAMVFLGERPHVFHGVGIALIGTGLVIAARKSRRA